jgi:hypothetical protein
MGGSFPVSIDELRDTVHSFQPGERVDVSYRRGALITETYVIIGSESVAQKQMQKATAVKPKPTGRSLEGTTSKPTTQQRTSAVPPQPNVRASNTVTKSATTAAAVAQEQVPREVSEPAEHTSSSGQSAAASPNSEHIVSPTAKIVPSREASSKPRVYVKGQGTVNTTTHSGGAISGSDSWVFGHRSNTTVDAHDESIELSKDIREQCPGVIVTLKEDSADFFVMLNRESKAKKGLLSKNSQVLVADKNGDVIWIKDVRQVKSAAKDVCSAILSPSK